MSSGRNRKTATILLIVCGSLILATIIAATYWHLFADKISPRVTVTSPVFNESGVSVATKIFVTFQEVILPRSLNDSTFILRNAQRRVIPATITFLPASRTAVLTPKFPLAVGEKYEVVVVGGPTGVHDFHGNAMEKDHSWNFYTASMTGQPPVTGSGGPIRIIASLKNPFSYYYTEILRNEGFNEFQTQDIATVTEATLTQADLAIVGEVPLTPEQADMLVSWVRSGGSLIAMRPDANLARRLGLKDSVSHLSNGYLAIDTLNPPGKGLTKETIQFHGDADIYPLNGGSRVATLDRDANTATEAPAVVIEKIGSGRAAVFAYDLARSVVYTRQGNPEWAGVERDGLVPMRSDDLFYGAAPDDPQPDWVDFNKIAIPQADEQQRLLAHLILMLNDDKMPLPRFSYFPNGFKSVVIMTGDDHGGAGTAGRFRRFIADSHPGCSVADWQCIRSTSNIFLGSITPEDATNYISQGFEIGLHVSTGCNDWPTNKKRGPDGKVVITILPDAMDSYYSSQLVNFTSMYAGIPSPVTTRTDCITWGDYDTQPQVELKYGIRLDTNYYYWPPKWVRNHPGLFTGSGMPMRFAKTDGTLIDVYQAATQMTDESGQSYPFTVDRLLDNAVGPKEYFGVFTANMHTDQPESTGANDIVASAKARGIPVIAANQMLKWLDGRNASFFQNLKWTGQALEFQISVGVGANGLQAQLPIHFSKGSFKGITFNGQPEKYVHRTIKGIEYAVFAALPGNYAATYGE